jgi:hypothetical protein
MRMHNLGVSVAIAVSVVSLAFARQKGFSQASDVRISKNHPTVYLTLERVGTREPRRQGESSAGVWLRLHNNTRWRIKLQAYGLSSIFIEGDEKEVGLYYEVGSIPKSGSRFREVGAPPVKEEPECPAPLLLYGDLRSGLELAPGQSVVFSVAREHLCKNLYVTVTFRYGWEPYGEEPEHRVRFYGSDVPEEVR